MLLLLQRVGSARCVTHRNAQVNKAHANPLSPFAAPQEFDQGKGYLSREDLALLVKKIVPGANPQELLYFRVMARLSGGLDGSC